MDQAERNDPERTRAILEKHAELCANVESFHAHVRGMYPAQVTCGAGCFSCCMSRLAVFPLEAEAIRRGALGMDQATRAMLRERLEVDSGPLAAYCAFLVEGVCSIYAYRPLLCRIHGLPNASSTYPAGVVDVCELNFSEMEAQEIAHEAVLDWDHAGNALALLNFKLTDRMGCDAYGRLRIPLLELAREIAGLPVERPTMEERIP